MKHQRRVVGHASGHQEQMDSCICGNTWPCPELLTQWEFDRYLDGHLMSEGVCISRAETFEQACQAAVRLASPGSVLVLKIVASAKSRWMPITVSHDHTKPPIGRMRQVENFIEVELRQPLAKQLVFKIFGDAAMMSLEQTFSSDGQIEGISKLRILGFSLCANPSEAPHGSV